MSLQFRRGVDTDRTSITPLAGEPLWITDTNELYVGDGSTAGGVQITGGGGGNVATDTIWNVKGDLAVADGPDSAIRLAVGTNNQFLTANSTTASGLQWRGINETDLPLTTLTGVIATPEAITFDQTHSQTAAVGKLQWDDDAGTLSLGLKGGNVQLKLGETQFVRVKNNTVSQIDAYKVVYLTGATGDTPNIALADADSESTSADTLGFTVENIAASGSGFVVIAGTVKGFNTSGMSLGATVYLSGTAGGFTTTAPTAPSHRVTLGYVAKAAAAPDGIIYVKVDNGYELDELHNVNITTVADNHFLVYNNANNRWENESPSDARTSLGLGTAATSNTGDFAAASHTHAAGDITSGTLAIARGGTNLGTTPTNGQLLIGNGTDYTLSTLTAGSNVTITNASGSITIASTGGSGGTKTYAFFTPLDAQPPASNFATLDTRQDIAVLEFDGGATDESTTFVGIMPEGASLGSGLKVRIHWMADTANTSSNVRWGVQFQRLTDDVDAAAYDTAVEGNSAAPTGTGADGTPAVLELTVTTIDGITAGDAYRLKVYREASDTTNDTMTGDAQLVSIEVRSAA